MLVIEEPYVSPFLLKTAEKNQFAVLQNKITCKYGEEYKLNILSDVLAKEFLNSEINPLVYSNSENSINWILNNFSESDLAKNIRLFKDKNAFREILTSIYPDFFFKEYDINDLENIDIDVIPKPFVIKPTVGFLSLGVYTVNNNDEWSSVLESIKNDSGSFSDMFPDEVVNSSKFIVEEFIEGEEFAVDAFYSQSGKPVILNIFKHPFVSENDVSDRVYMTSKEIIESNIQNFTNVLEKIGKLADLKAFPMHIELRVSKEGKIVPIEINPMRFAGWCTTDIAYYAYGINSYEYYLNQLEPDWGSMLKGKEGKIYYFSFIETPSNIDKNMIEKFDYSGLLKNFSSPAEVRKFDYVNQPLFAIIFGETHSIDEINKILEINLMDFIELKEISLRK